MALLAAARRASAVICPSHGRDLLLDQAELLLLLPPALRAKADSYRDEATTYRAKATSLRAQAESVNASIHDGVVIDVIDSAIQSHDSYLVDGIPSDFPFEISKEEGLSDITLTRSLNGEQIEVLVSMSNPDSDDEESSDFGHSSDEAEADNDMPLRVTVSKADGSSLQFTCTADPHLIFIETVSVWQPPSGAKEQEDAVASKDDPVACDECPDFSELDESLLEPRSLRDDSLQEALRKYLELRGITAMNIQLLQQYLNSKDTLCYQLWLNKLRDFVKKE